MSEDSLHPNKDRYQILSMLGRGYSGTVYRAGDTVLDKTVALKVLEIGRDASKVIRFQNEARVVARLDHPNIVKVLDFNLNQENKMYLVFELIEGKSLRSMIVERGAIPLSEWLVLGEDILLGLEHAHANGVTHRDLNPNNVLIDYSNPDVPRAKIVDFGIACLADYDLNLTGEGVGIGTPHYMSPEQCRGREATPASDIYSFGCLCFVSLTGRPPHQCDTVLDTVLAHINIPAPRLSEVRPDLRFPRQLEEIVEKALQREPGQRYLSATELLSAFQALAESMAKESETPKEESRAMTPPLVKSGNWKAWSIIALAGVVIVTVASLGYYNRLFASADPEYDFRRVAKEHPPMLAPFDGPSAPASETRVSSGSDRALKDSVMGELGRIPDIEELEQGAPPTLEASIPINGGSIAVDITPQEMKLAKALRETKLEQSDPGIYHVKCYGDDALRVVRQACKINQLYVSGGFTIRGPGLVHLSGIPLEVLEIKKSQITDAGLDYFPVLPRLITLAVVYDKHLLGTGFNTKKFPNLKHLNVQVTGVTDEGLKHICSMTQLEMLVLSNTAITGSTLHCISQMPGLKILALGHCPIQPSYLSSVASAPQLRNVNIDGLKTGTYDFLFKLKHLQNLSINDSAITDQQFVELIARCKQLRFLSIKRCSNLTMSGLQALAQSKVSHLYISRDQRVNDEFVDVLIKCKNLSVVEAEQTRLSIQGLSKLLAKSSIDHISISEPITELEAQQLKRLYPRKHIEYVEDI